MSSAEKEPADNAVAFIAQAAAVSPPAPEPGPATAPPAAAVEPSKSSPAVAAQDGAAAEGGPPDTGDAAMLEARREAETQRNAERDREIVEEFQYLLEKSQQLFSGLSDLPEIGSKYWQPHFQRTFEVYTKLWKFQSQHRVLLEKAEHYGLKRWEVGEIASKIGQLYYRYYLRTSETNYLQEAFVFYDAIRERNYFTGEQEVKNSALMIKKLRYYARFIVVCLQMNNTMMMLQLLEEVKSLIDVYATTFNPVDKMEWSLVVKEMALFMQAVCSPVPTDDSGMPLPVSYRLVPRRRARADRAESRFRLQEAVVVGNRPTQIKFSELTLDMYYVLQMLEREPSVNVASTTSTPAAIAESTPTAAAETGSAGASEAARSPEMPESATSSVALAQERAANAEGAAPHNPDTARPDSAATGESKDRARERADGEQERAVRRPNPHKYVLYQPSVSQVQVYLANAFREVGDQGCVLLYLSSDGQRADAGDGAAAAAAQYGFIGGISTARRTTGEASQDRSTEQLINTVHPADLVPFTRKPLFLIVESESSLAYKDMPNLFGQPQLSLLSPTQYPVATGSGSMYTFFLHSPAVAFCVLAQIGTMPAAKWAGVERMFGDLEDAAWELLAALPATGAGRFLSDDFLRQIVVRHVLCCVVLGLHVEFTRPEHLPQASPELFAGLAQAPALVRGVRDIAEFCAAAECFRMAEPSRPPSPVQTPPSSQHLADVTAT
ncbi:hypothetical protein IWW52_004745 [Coemansia sp. RSA 2704]|nr:hypothetical protein IWW52_004745 [Coemansia sp. RSA 2704]